MTKLKYGLYDDKEKARLAVLKNEVDVAVIESGNIGATSFMVKEPLDEESMPKKLTTLPGFKFVGVAGIPAPPVSTYACLRTSVEVISVLKLI